MATVEAQGGLGARTAEGLIESAARGLEPDEPLSGEEKTNASNEV